MRILAVVCFCFRSMIIAIFLCYSLDDCPCRFPLQPVQAPSPNWPKKRCRNEWLAPIEITTIEELPRGRTHGVLHQLKLNWTGDLFYSRPAGGLSSGKPNPRPKWAPCLTKKATKVGMSLSIKLCIFATEYESSIQPYRSPVLISTLCVPRSTFTTALAHSQRHMRTYPIILQA